MITFLAVKRIAKKTWVWVKHNWQVPLIILYTLALWFLFRRKNRAVSILEERNKSYKEQIDAIDKIHKEEVERRNKILEEYNKILTELEEKYKEDKLELDSKKKKEVKKLVEKYHDNPDELAKLLAEKYGLNYVK